MSSGLSLYNISHSYAQAGDLDRAMECARESLRVLQTALSPGHQDIVYAEKMILYLARHGKKMTTRWPLPLEPRAAFKRVCSIVSAA